MSWFDRFSQEAKEFDRQLSALQDICNFYGICYEDKVEEARYLAEVTIMSNIEAVHYVFNNIKREKWCELTIQRAPNGTGVDSIVSKIKGDNDMFDVNNIKVGDILIDWEDRVGYVYDIYLRGDGYIRFYERRIGENVGREYDGRAMLLQRCFKQIGAYKFDKDKADKKPKIEKIDIHQVMKSSMDTFTDVTIIQKINEIVDYLNKED